MFPREGASGCGGLEQFRLDLRGDQGVSLRVIPRGAHSEPNVSVLILVDQERSIFRISHRGLRKFQIGKKQGSVTMSATLPSVNQAG